MFQRTKKRRRVFGVLLLLGLGGLAAVAAAYGLMHWFQWP
jgi:hypothetical protein